MVISTSLNQGLAKCKSKWSPRQSTPRIELPLKADTGGLKPTLSAACKVSAKSSRQEVQKDRNWSEREFLLTQVMAHGRSIQSQTSRMSGRSIAMFQSSLPHPVLSTLWQLSVSFTLIKNGAIRERKEWDWSTLPQLRPWGECWTNWPKNRTFPCLT